MSFLKKNWFSVLPIIILVLVGIPAAIFLTQQRQDVRQRAAGSHTISGRVVDERGVGIGNLSLFTCPIPGTGNTITTPFTTDAFGGFSRVVTSHAGFCARVTLASLPVRLRALDDKNHDAINNNVDVKVPFRRAYEFQIAGSNCYKNAAGGCGGPQVIHDRSIDSGYDFKIVPLREASCAGVDAPASVTPGQKFSAQVRMKNNGTGWLTGGNNPYILGSVGANSKSWGTERATLTSETLAGATATFNIAATAPTTPGTYTFAWEMLQEGVAWFGSGSACQKSITVAAAPAPTTRCNDNIDNDNNGVKDAEDASCHTDGIASNAASYDPKINGENGSTCADGKDNNGNGKIDGADPICHTGGNINNPYDPNLPETGGSGTSFLITVLLHGIGVSGDNANPTASSLSNKNPKTPTRKATLSFYNSVTDQLVTTATGDISYSSTNGNYVGKVVTSSPLAAGTYNIRAKTTQHLQRLFIPAKTISLTQDNLLPPITLVAGDINNDNKLNILDYNILMDCYSDLSPAKSCSDANKKISADINDDGLVNQTDYNLFIRNISTQPGE